LLCLPEDNPARLLEGDRGDTSPKKGDTHMTHTPNYNLNQWDPTDRILRSDFNEDNAALDAALSAHDAALAKRGNCSVETFSYTGTGTYGDAHPTIIHFRALPKAYFILNGVFLAGAGGDRFGRVMAYNQGAVNNTVDTSWSGSTLRIISTSAITQANVSGLKYTVVAFYTVG